MSRLYSQVPLASSLGSKYSNTRYPPETIVTIPNLDALVTRMFGFFGPEGLRQQSNATLWLERARRTCIQPLSRQPKGSKYPNMGVSGLTTKTVICCRLPLFSIQD